MTEERKELGRRVRKKLHELLPTCVAAVDHGEYLGAYFFAEDIPAASEIVKANPDAFEGLKVYVRPAPPLRGVLGITNPKF